MLEPGLISSTTQPEFPFHYFQTDLQHFKMLHTVSPPFVSDVGATTKTDELTLMFILRGSVTITRRDVRTGVSEIEYRPPRAVLFNHKGESSACSTEGLEMIMLTFPGDLLAKRGIDTDDQVQLEGPEVELVVGVLKQFIQIGASANSLAELAFARSLEEAVVALLVSQQPSAEATARFDQVQYDRAITLIQTHSNTTSLTPQRLAEKLGVALRSLQRLFAAAGTTIAEQIQLARVRTAESILISDEGHSLRIAEVAARAGFSSESRLRTAMAEVSGVNPRSFRTGRYR